jgi:adenine-specific DNA-methyltransferase
MDETAAEIEALVLGLVPADGGGIGNRALLTAVLGQRPDLTDDDCEAARERLIAAGVLGRGGGRGGSVYRLRARAAGGGQGVADDASDAAEADADPAEAPDSAAPNDSFALRQPVPAPASAPRAPRAKPAPRKPAAQPVAVLSYRHPDLRANNPEVGMVHPGNDPDAPKTRWAYDPHLDPVLNFDTARAGIERLIDDALASDDPARMREALLELKRLQQPYLQWTGKAEGTSFEVDTVSLHVHERVDPATILAHAARRLKGKDAAQQWRQPDLFDAPFENLPLRQALDFYRHEKGWSNRLVAGDSLLVMNSLLTKEGMAGKVQMIYIDPPYGIKYGSNFQPFTNKRDVKDRADDDLTQEPEMIKAFRDTWELGIHSYLTYLRDRVILARELLNDTGSVFVQISDENLHHVRQLLAEVFGAENSMSLISYSTTGGFASSGLSRTGDYVLWFAQNKEKVKFNRLYLQKDQFDAARGDYDQAEFANGSRGPLPKEQKLKPEIIPDDTRLFTDDNPSSQGVGAATVGWDWCGLSFHPGAANHWKAPVPHGMRRLTRANRFLITPHGKLRYVRFFEDFDQISITDNWLDIAGAVQDRADPKVYVVQTSNKIVERCVLMVTDPGDLVFDPTCGSGTTAFVAEKWGRRWITCDTSRVAIALAKQRLMTASFDYYALAYPTEGLEAGFEYEKTSRVMLGQIANNPDIDTIWDEDHPNIEAALAELNAALLAAPPKPLKPTQGVRKGKPVNFGNGEALHEWEVPFDWPEADQGAWPEAARAPFDAFHAARQAMQRRMDRSIADHAEQETLYDRPRIDKTRLRISGPFSVEAVPAPTVLALDSISPSQPLSEAERSLPEADETIARCGETSRQAQWRDELLKTGVRAKGGAVLRLAELETLPGLRYIHASGSLAETGERVVVSFGPEHAALEQRQVELALGEVETLRPAPKLVLFCAFTFDPEAAKDIDEVNWPGVTLLKAQMNTDLLTADLKKARASNQSFWLMGQPEVELRRRKDGLWEVEVNGFDYFDPRKGDVVSGGKQQIAMWSLDIDYDNRSLLPHQVFFPMADAKGGWHRLRKTVRAELDEDLLAQFHGTVSLPFPSGEHRRIAVKIVDDRGIESLKILPLGD